MTANVGETGVELVCEVKARPEVTALYWMIDKTTGVIVPSDDSMAEYWTTNMVSWSLLTGHFPASIAVAGRLIIERIMRISAI